MKRIGTLAIISIISFFIANGQNKPDPYTILLKAGPLSLPINAKEFTDSIRLHPPADALQVLLQFYDLPDYEQRIVLENKDIRLLSYVGGNAYISILSPEALRSLPILNIRSIALVQPQWKLDPRVNSLVSSRTNKQHELVASFDKALKADEIKKILSQHNATISSSKFALENAYEILIPGNDIRSLASNAYVTYISITAKDVSLNNDQRSLSAANFVHNALGLDGTGITVGVGDNSSGLFHTDLRDRVINFNPDVPEQHGQHVTGTVAGKGILDPKARGMAPNARILGHLYNIVWAQTSPMYSGYNMTLTNNSYAAVVGDCAVAGTYDNYSKLLDDYAHTYPEVLNVFAVGNDGQKDCAPYPSGYGTVCGIYQTAKNVLTVGSMRRLYTDHEESAKGPVKDGRIKPEVIAMGADLYSTTIYDAYIGSTGTSMASPGAAGALALLSQRYKQLNSNNNPSNALLKALIINGATDVGNIGPDYKHGFGFINLYRSIEMLNNNRVHTNTISQNGLQNVAINVPANTAQLKVLLYWNDASANPSSAATLVNNLDLTVTEPNNVLHRPLVLDPTPANVTNPAIEAVDNLNNVEQVVINNPQAGSYTAEIKGTALPSATQNYYLVYDIIPNGITLKYPVANLPVPANETSIIYWDASDNANNYTLEYSDNNGASWNVIDNNIPSVQKYYQWVVPNISTAQALIRITRNNTTMQAVSGQFVINPQPVLQLDAVQCPGYVAFNWNSVPNASSYQILKKTGEDLQPVDTVTGNSYTVKGLPFNEKQFIAITPIINGKSGYRSKALARLPNDGTCSGNISDHDLSIERVITPVSGRKFTSTELTSNETMSLTLRNLDDVAQGSYKISYKVNNNSWLSQNFTTPIAANATGNVILSGLNLSSVGTYQITVAIENMNVTDPVKENDTLRFDIRQLANDPVDIANVFREDFETTGSLTLIRDEMGVLQGDHWDFENTTDSGRLRTFVGSDVTISGQRSASMDLLYNLPDNRNFLYGTFNLNNYTTAATEARLEFDYKLHGTPKFQEGNDVYVRGNDAATWVKLLDIDTNAAEGVTTKTGSLSITNALLNAGQNFSTSFQVRIGQHDTSAIAANEYGNGLTIDNFKLYSVKNDVQLLSVVSPASLSCGLSSSEPVTVKVYNSDNLGQSNIQLFYRFENGPVVSQQLDTLAPKDTVDFTFTQPVSLATIGYHALDVWLSAAGDTYLLNDSILNYNIRNQPLISSYPYLENFENGDGNWFTEGSPSSWQYGIPASDKINKAASGTKVWKTNLAGKYSNNELSYLYSPCYDLSNLANPMLSFSLSTDIENCGDQLCDRAYLEYSEDGKTWIRLGKKGDGTNWYPNASQVWNEQDNTRWRVASIPLPASNALKLRFVFQSDPGASREGIAVDDMHIFDLNYPIYDNETIYAVSSQGVNQSEFTTDGKILGQLLGQSLGSSTVTAYFHRSAYQPLLRQYFIPRNYTIQTANSPQAEVQTRLYLTDAEVLKMIADNNCSDCSKAEDAYRLGILKYDDMEPRENGSLLDNAEGKYDFIPPTSVQWVPYDKGYYAQFETGSFSEFWFTTDMPQQKVTGTVVFPNPVSDGKLHIAWYGKPLDQLQISIYDVVGKLVYENKVTAQDTDNLSTFTLPQLSTGMYLVRYKTQLEKGEAKIMVRN